MEPIPINHHSYDSDDDFVAKRKIKSAEKVTEMWEMREGHSELKYHHSECE